MLISVRSVGTTFKTICRVSFALSVLRLNCSICPSTMVGSGVAEASLVDVGSATRNSTCPTAVLPVFSRLTLTNAGLFRLINFGDWIVVRMAESLLLTIVEEPVRVVLAVELLATCIAGGFFGGWGFLTATGLFVGVGTEGGAIGSALTCGKPGTLGTKLWRRTRDTVWGTAFRMVAPVCGCS